MSKRSPSADDHDRDRFQATKSRKRSSNNQYTNISAHGNSIEVANVNPTNPSTNQNTNQYTNISAHSDSIEDANVNPTNPTNPNTNQNTNQYTNISAHSQKTMPSQRSTQYGCEEVCAYCYGTANTLSLTRLIRCKDCQFSFHSECEPSCCYKCDEL
jgi:hypothetical protein